MQRGLGALALLLLTAALLPDLGPCCAPPQSFRLDLSAGDCCSDMGVPCPAGLGNPLTLILDRDFSLTAGPAWTGHVPGAMTSSGRPAVISSFLAGRENPSRASGRNSPLLI